METYGQMIMTIYVHQELKCDLRRAFVEVSCQVRHEKVSLFVGEEESNPYVRRHVKVRVAWSDFVIC